MMTPKDLSRRSFLKGGALALAALPLAAVIAPSALAKKKEKKSAAGDAPKDAPLPDGEKAVEESDAVATALGYKANAKDVDVEKYPKRKGAEGKKQFCNNCSFYSKSNDGWGKCTMLQSGLVKSSGWCNSWQKKA
jgi:hypothetical protein